MLLKRPRWGIDVVTGSRVRAGAVTYAGCGVNVAVEVRNPGCVPVAGSIAPEEPPRCGTAVVLATAMWHRGGWRGQWHPGGRWLAVGSGIPVGDGIPVGGGVAVVGGDRRPGLPSGVSAGQ